MTSIVWGHKNRSLPTLAIELASGPYVRDRNPAPGASAVPQASDVLFTIASALPQTVSLSSVVITFSINGAAPSTVYTGSAFQAGYGGTVSHVVTALEDSYQFSIDPAIDFPSNAQITVSIQALDSLANPISPAESYSFFSAFLSPSPPPPPLVLVDLFPKLDSFRGGGSVVVHGVPKLVDPSLDVSFLGQTLPMTWTSSLTGTGAYASSRFDGLTLSTGPVGGSTSSVASSTAWTSFDAVLTVKPVAPSQTPSSVVSLLTFGFTVDGSNYLQVKVSRDPLAPSGMLSVSTIVSTDDATVDGGGVFLPVTSELTLRIVRHQNFAFLFVNDTPLGLTTRFIPTGMGTFSASVSNGSANVRVSTIVTGLTLRSHALIGPRLIDGKIDFSTRRLLGTVPAASLAEVGSVPIIVFGPWGSLTLPQPFEYQLGEGKTVGGQTSSPFVSYDDPVVKN